MNPTPLAHEEINGTFRSGLWLLGGDLFDRSEAPFKEIPVASTTTDPAAIVARKQLQEVLDESPAAAGGLNRKSAKAAKKEAHKL